MGLLLNRFPAAGLLLLPCFLLATTPARAQDRRAFVEATLEFFRSAEGAFGDEGRYLLAAVESMARALSEWDTALARAESALTAVVAGAPPEQVASARLALAALEIDRGRFERALAEIEQVPAAAQADAYVLKGLALERLGRTGDSFAAYHEGWRRSPRTLAAAYRVATAQGDVLESSREAAIGELITAAARPDGVRRLLFPTDAFLDEASARVPLLPPSRYAAAAALLRQGRYDAAVDALRRAAAADPLTHASPGLAAAAGALRVGDAAGAIERLTDTASGLSASAETHRVLGLAYRASGDSGRALEEFRAAMRLDSEDERSRLAAARILVGDGRAAEAQLVLRQGVDGAHRSDRALWELGQLAIADGDWAEAITALEPVAAAGPLVGTAALEAQLGRAYAARGDADGVARAARARAEAIPHVSGAHADLGRAHRAAGRPTQALVEFLAAVLLDPRSQELRVELGEILTSLGRAGDTAALSNAPEPR